ncbi:hypothetical protein CANARDRAFT_29432 [[Candida] arabinofermentans NRRL YB-2248]|uniref:C2 domain-containing protein n=1 Tax=[Candida] arabinofermentans NRRL YB-2248 TaxID=983967 RepID=A0A1E4SWY7_9ASCO|nr:hypothetical protein CANARDRAFT_29432 [[Candida] arabinofermentans NRRL YB-2248]
MSTFMDTSTRIKCSGNQLVVVVSKAQDLPNRRKLDKQSPYCVARIQDQVQRTRVVPRGGQNPTFDEELWFSLDNVEDTTLILSMYHQQKKDSELVCKAEIDFSPALRRSVKEGYDNWHTLEYNGKPAGKVFLEMTYYTASTSVPLQVENALRSSMMMSTGSKFNNSAATARAEGTFKPNMSMISAVPQSSIDLPDLEHPKVVSKEINNTSNNNSTVQEIQKQQVDSSEGQKGWMSKIMDNAYNINIPSIFNRGLFSQQGHHQDPLDTLDIEIQNTAFRNKLFADSSDEESDEEEEEEDNLEIDEDGEYQLKKTAKEKSINITTPMHKSPFTRQPSLTSKINDDDKEVFEVGQKVSFRSSINSRSPLNMLNEDESDEDEMESMRQSFKGKPLPSIIKATSESRSQSPRNLNNKENNLAVETPPRPPAHCVPLTPLNTSLFENSPPSSPSPFSRKNRNEQPFTSESNGTKHSLPQTAPTPYELLGFGSQEKNTSPTSPSRLRHQLKNGGGSPSYSQIRKQNLGRI